MNWRFILAITSLIALVFSSLSLALAVASPLSLPIRTCWDAFSQEPLKKTLSGVWSANMACPFILHGMATACLGLFISGYLLVGVLRCIIPPHIINPFEQRRVVVIISYLFIMILITLALACLLTTIGLLHYYSKTLTDKDSIGYYTGNVITNCIRPEERYCASLVLLIIAICVVGFGVTVAIVEIVYVILEQGRNHYSIL
ncbi:hypothetical protein RF11_15946 [Thelohanellus kitauei]|uniref:Uncharacterized protein n=1 Tax=Thelohanellus kitauei TaxID=669202 RepID=A0A0C2MXY0_THEKT|nr:hypothetical protein RF11_15946 [Thelohanellus kitauei]